MRILMANSYARLTGGADVHCLDLIETLRGAGHEVLLLSTASDQNVVPDGVFVELTVTGLNRDALRGRDRLRAARRAIWNPEAAAATASAIRSFKPDVLHTHKLYPQLSVAPVVVARRARVPVVHTLHDYELLSANSQDPEGTWIDRRETRLSYRTLNTATYPLRRVLHARAASAIAISRFVAAAHRRRGIPSTVLPNFTRVHPDHPGSNPAGRRGVVFVGRLTPEKGVAHVLGLAEAHPDIDVRIAGHGPLEARVVEAASKLPNVEYLGVLARDELPAALASARLALMPSLWAEPGGLSALEAMACGTPVVAYKSGGLSEYVLDAGGGIVVEPDADALASAAQRLCDDNGFWEQVSRNGLRAVHERHTPDKYATRLVEEVYRPVAEGSAARRRLA
jgi:glycosyltransferase involved in cell wall biosynthesis